MKASKTKGTMEANKVLEKDYDQECLPLYKEFLKECKELKKNQDAAYVLDFARTLQNLVAIQSGIMLMADDVGEEGKFLVFDKLYAESEAFCLNLYTKLPFSGLA